MARKRRTSEECMTLILDEIKASSDELGMKAAHFKVKHKMSESTVYRCLKQLQSMSKIRQRLGSKNWFLTEEAAAEKKPVINPGPYCTIDGMNMRIDSDKYKVYTALRDAWPNGCTIDQLIKTTGLERTIIHARTNRLKEDLMVCKIDYTWYINKGAKPAKTVADANQKSQRELVLDCLRTFASEDKSCTIWDIMTVTNVQKSNIRVMIHRIKEYHDVLIDGKGDDITYRYIKPGKKEPKVKARPHVSSDTTKRLAKKAWFLLQALDTIDIGAICKHFVVTTDEAESVMRLLLSKHSGELKNITLNIK